MTTQPLLQPVRLGALELPNSVVMAPMTRARAHNGELAPTDLHATYYAQRATAGLIVTEGTWVSPDAIGFINVPGIYTDTQTMRLGEGHRSRPRGGRTDHLPARPRWSGLPPRPPRRPPARGTLGHQPRREVLHSLRPEGHPHPARLHRR